ncbi:hypothetical protein FACS1894130_04450 [Spirochaetia bacterium]|nr:hypothetical protein FACS1894130_04450 [Spirochaetia bacterium]
MTIVDMLGQSGVLTLLGMGIVFSFLAIVIISVTCMGKIVHALGADKDVGASPSTAAKPALASASAGQPAVTAAISAAVNEYRKTESR